jgi:hypothetical protein
MGNNLSLNKNPDIVLYERNINTRISVINGIPLILREDYRANRKNVICYSKKMQEYIDKNKLNETDNRLIGSLIYKNPPYDDIQVLSVDGYY